MGLLRASVVAVVLGGLVQSAAAAEAPAVSQWSGFYAGVAAGAGWGTAEQTDSTVTFGPFTSGTYHTQGPIFGLSAGYNWQAGAFVFGAETDLSFAAIKGVEDNPGSCIISCESEIVALGTARGRLGLAAGNWLPFITGGLAYAKLRGAEGLSAGFGGSGSTWVAGYTIGGGVEAKLASQWSVKLEYLFVDLGKHEVWTNALPFGVIARESLDVAAHVVRVGINYHF